LSEGEQVKPHIVLIGLADDEERQVASTLLGGGFGVSCCAALREASDVLTERDSGLAIVAGRSMGRDPPRCLVTALRGLGWKSAILVLGSGALEEELDVLDAGADDYIARPYELQKLFVRTSVLLRRSRESTAKILRHGQVVVNQATARAFLEGTELALTRAEFRLLAYLLANQGRVVPRDEIERQVLESTSAMAESSKVRVHISRLCKKLGPFKGMIRNVRGSGYTVEGRKAHGQSS
jgi:DNA-binding response OmpR family regulator